MLVGDVVGLRQAADRFGLHRAVTAALGQVADGAIDPPKFTIGDEFQGSYPTAGAAIDAALSLRLSVSPNIDVRFGLGWGAAADLDAEAGIQDGPGWWAARDAIQETAEAQRRPGFTRTRTTFRASDNSRDDAAAINAAFLCRDHLLGSLSDRSLRILKGLMNGQTKKELATAEGISPSAVSQRASRDGLDLIILVSQYLRNLP